MTIVNHQKRYAIQREFGGWFTIKTTNSLWRAKRIARYREELGQYTYRVVDTRGNRGNNP